MMFCEQTATINGYTKSGDLEGNLGAQNFIKYTAHFSRGLGGSKILFNLYFKDLAGLSLV